MNNVTDPFTIPEVNGTFNNWCGNCWAMSDVNNDNIWTFTASVPAGSYEYKFAADNWALQEDLSTASGCVVSAWGFTNRFLNITSDTILDVVCWESCSACIVADYYGCTDPTACNYDATATIDDGSCEFTSCTTCNSVPTGLNAWDITDTKFRLGWDNMNTSNCMVLNYNVRFRVTGTTTWTTRSAGAGNGLCNFGINNVEKLMINFLPSTTYDVRLRVQYCGMPSPSAWTSTLNVTTADGCPDITNIQVQTFNGQQNKAKFTWDETTGPYAFVRLWTRVNLTGYPWTLQGGFGVDYPALLLNIFSFTPGETYRVQGKSYCSYTITSFKGNLTPPVIWTQPGSIRLEGGTAIANLDIYPNPSRGIFNVTFTSETIQDLKVRILNVIGEEFINEDLQQFIGEYTQQINLTNNSKGIYFLEIETNNGMINKKLILL
jgi:hypothetical protein